MKKSIIITSVDDLEELRFLKDVRILSLSIIEDLDFEFKDFEPISLNNCSIIINGFDHVLSNLYLSADEDGLGLFKVNGDVILNNVIIDEFIVVGANEVGAVVGSCQSLILRNVSLLNSIINGNSYVGGFAGSCTKVYANNLAIYSDIKGNEKVGAITGACHDAIIECTSVDKPIEMMDHDFQNQHMIYTGATNNIKIDRYSINAGITFPYNSESGKKLIYKQK